MAAHAVFNTTELLEAVLLQLPAQDIIIAADVCTTWRGVVESSRGIRYSMSNLEDEQLSQHLWHLPIRYKDDTDSRSWWWDSLPDSSTPLVWHDFPGGIVVVTRHAKAEYFAVLFKGEDDDVISINIVDDNRRVLGFGRKNENVWWMAYRDLDFDIYHEGRIHSSEAAMFGYLFLFHGIQRDTPYLKAFHRKADRELQKLIEDSGRLRIVYKSGMSVCIDA